MGEAIADLQNVWSALAAIRSSGGATIMFIGARSGDGISTCAQNFAKLAATRATKSAWLLDLDFFVDGQYSSLGGLQKKWQGPFDMTFGRAPFWRATPRMAGAAQGEGAIVGYRVGNTKLFVSKFRRETLSQGQSIQVGPAPEYWRAVKNAIDITVVDAPPIEKSRSGLAICQDMDAVVLVLNANSDGRDAFELRDEILARNGNILGVVMVNGNRTKVA